MDPKKKPVPPVFLLLSIITMVLLHRFVPVLAFDGYGRFIAGSVLLAAGMGVTVPSARLFSKLGTPVRPFEESTTVVTAGMFRFTRNPMYLGMVLAQLGLACLLGNLAAFAPIPVFVAIIHFQFILHEERFMEGLFGEEYLAYKRRVRRWI